MGKNKCRIITNDIAHIYNRGVEKRKIFLDSGYYLRFLSILNHYTTYDYAYSRIKTRLKNAKSAKERKHTQEFLNTKRIQKPVEIISYCLMPNHYHITLKQLVDGGTSQFMHRIGTSYTNYFNIRQDRAGRLFEGPFKVVKVNSAKQLCHLARYQHTNPLSIGVESRNELSKYPWSSLAIYLNEIDNKLVNTKTVLENFNSRTSFEEFTFQKVDEFEPVRLESVAIDDDFEWFAKFKAFKKARQQQLREQYLENAVM